ncbi:hypothetical protein AB0L59_26560 [Streptomyces sp. NPDC052109]|uniref:hypothetical protein n=1 Tax=Streptomyces sp. NPDC052109 TaxID=3155527 RepID=UPI0034427825
MSEQQGWPGPFTEEEGETAPRSALSAGYQRGTVTGEQNDDAGPVRPDEEPTT